MEELLQLGGPILWIQIGITFVAFLLIFEKLLFFQTTRLKESDILIGLGNHLKKRAYAEARHEASQCKGPMGRVLYTIVTRHHLERIELRGIAEDAVGLELPQIESNLKELMTLVYLAPLSGMLGTVLGMMDVFIQINEGGGFVTQAKMAQGLFESLITTASGLVIALFAYICYMYLHARARQMVYRLDAAAVNLVNLIIDARNYASTVSVDSAAVSKKKKKGKDA